MLALGFEGSLEFQQMNVDSLSKDRGTQCLENGTSVFSCVFGEEEGTLEEIKLKELV